MTIGPLIRRLTTHPWLALAFRLYIGGLFIHASMYKINYVGEFAGTIASYQLAPYALVNFMAVTMPWLELICGLMLVVGFRTKASASILGALMVLFTVAIVINLYWDAPIGCGCFKTIEDPISWKTVVRDLIWLAMIVHVFLFDRSLQVDRLLFQPLEEMET
ncbi:MAG: DoxX family membrane protein [Deltaproteobacteria bacterium]|nr:DoxX family membrane protein [Deltaproteobacteria bacterium]